jgi:hypothetical protein
MLKAQFAVSEAVAEVERCWRKWEILAKAVEGDALAYTASTEVKAGRAAVALAVLEAVEKAEVARRWKEWAAAKAAAEAAEAV